MVELYHRANTYCICITIVCVIGRLARCFTLLFENLFSLNIISVGYLRRQIELFRRKSWYYPDPGTRKGHRSWTPEHFFETLSTCVNLGGHCNFCRVYLLQRLVDTLSWIRVPEYKSNNFVHKLITFKLLYCNTVQ